MITLPITCNQLWFILWVITGILILVGFLYNFNFIIMGILSGLFIVGIIILSCVLGLKLYDKYGWPIKCKCGGD